MFNDATVEMIANGISLTLLLAFLFPVIMLLKDGNYWWGWLLIMLVITNIAVEPLKRLIRNPRPSDAKNCNAFCRGGDVGGEPGFPSGHMTTTTMFVAMLWLHFKHRYILYAGIPWIILMGWSRWVKKCHTWEQILGGIVTGTIFAYVLSTAKYLT